MPLIRWTDFQAPASSNRSRPVWQLVLERIHSETRPMPPPPFARLVGAEERVLSAWLEAGAPESGDVCEDQDVIIGMDPLPCTPTESYRAHAPGSLDEGVVVGGGDFTLCFEFRRPAAFAQAVAWGPVLDDLRVLHHVNLYASASPVTDGAIGPCRHTDLTYLMGWEAGRGNTVLPSDVGLELPSGASGMVLEIHYFNSSGEPARDRSGMAICTVDQRRPNTAGVLTLGTKSILVPPNSDAEAVGTCPASITEALAQPLKILSSAPHMHRFGLSQETEISRTDGTNELLSQVQHWDPELQPAYAHAPAFEIHPGDVLRTRCRYTNPLDRELRFGATTADEMCFNYNIAYPISALPPSVATNPLHLCDCPTGEVCSP